MRLFSKEKKKQIANVLTCVFYGLIGGVLTGGVIFLFKWLAGRTEALSRWLYGLMSGSPIYIALTFLVLVLLALGLSFIHKRLPEVRGGGIPRSEGVLRGTLSFKCVRTLIGTFVCSMLAFFVGLPLGCEGPAVLMGTCIGGIVANIGKKKGAWSRYVTSGGAGAGFAVATGAPLSGMLFSLEEVHKRFTPLLVLTVAVSVISATIVNESLCGAFNMSAKLFEIGTFSEFKLEHLHYLALLGVIVALFVALFDASIIHFSDFTKKIKKHLTARVKLVLVFIITGVLAFTLADGVYSGHHVIVETLKANVVLSMVIVLFIVRFIMMLFVTDSGATGGIFIPTLAIGALVGAGCAELLILLGLPQEYYAVVVMISTCAFMGGTLRSPFIAVVLFVELGSQYVNLLYVVLVVFIVTVITEMFNLISFYDKVLYNMEEHEHDGKQPTVAFFETTVSEDSFVAGKTIRDIMWPSSTVVVGVKYAGTNKSDDVGGERRIFAGDTIIVRAKYYDEQELKTKLLELVGESSIVEKHDTIGK